MVHAREDDGKVVVGRESTEDLAVEKCGEGPPGEPHGPFTASGGGGTGNVKEQRLPTSSSKSSVYPPARLTAQRLSAVGTHQTVYSKGKVHQLKEAAKRDGRVEGAAVRLEAAPPSTDKSAAQGCSSASPRRGCCQCSAAASTV